MKNLIKKILKEYEEEKIISIPGLHYFNNDWDLLQSFLKSKGNPKWKISDNLDLEGTPIQSLGNLTSVRGDLYLEDTSIKSLGNLTSVGGSLYLYGTPIQSLGNLQSVGSYLNLRNTPIESLGNLQSVEGDLYLTNTPISKKYTEEQIREMIDVEDDIYL